MERPLCVTACVSLQDYFQAHGEQEEPDLTGVWWFSSWRTEIEGWLRNDSYPDTGADCYGPN